MMAIVQAKKVAKNTGFLYIRMVITVFISLYVTRLLLAALGTEDFGIYSVVAGMVAMLVFLNSAMTSASQRYMSFAQGEGNEEKQIKIFSASVVLHFIIAILVVILIEIVGYFLFENVLQIPENRISAANLIFHFMVVSTFFAIISVPYDSVIIAHENMLFVAINGVIEAILKLTIALYITYFALPDKLIIYGFLMAILGIALFFVRGFFCHKKYVAVQLNVNDHFDKKLFIEMSNFAGWSLLGSSTSMVTNYGQGIVLNSYFGPIANAAQGIASQISGQLGAFSQTMLVALKPMIAKSEGSGNRNLMLKASLIGSRISFFLLLFFYIPVYLEMPYIFSIWLKETPPYAIIFCRLLLIRNLIEIMCIPLGSSIEAVGNIKMFQIASAFLNTLPLILSAILFSKNFNPETIYWVFIGYAILNFGIILFFAKIKCNLSISYFFKSVITPCLSVFFGVLIITMIPQFLLKDDFLRLLFTLLFSSVSFITLVWWLGLTNEENEEIRKILSQKLSKKS